MTKILADEKLEAKTLKKMHERIIKNFMDITILAELRNGPNSRNDIISFIHNKFHPLVSSGTVYSLILATKKRANRRNMKRKKNSLQTRGKRQKTIETILNANDKT